MWRRAIRRIRLKVHTVVNGHSPGSVPGYAFPQGRPAVFVGDKHESVRNPAEEPLQRHEAAAVPRWHVIVKIEAMDNVDSERHPREPRCHPPYRGRHGAVQVDGCKAFAPHQPVERPHRRDMHQGVEPPAEPDLVHPIAAGGKLFEPLGPGTSDVHFVTGIDEGA